MAVAVQDEALTSFEGFAGTLFRPGDAGYDETRRVHNGLIDKRPALIARCNGVADVVAAVNFAREHGPRDRRPRRRPQCRRHRASTTALMIDLS